MRDDAGTGPGSASATGRHCMSLIMLLECCWKGRKFETAAGLRRGG